MALPIALPHRQCVTRMVFEMANFFETVSAKIRLVFFGRSLIRHTVPHTLYVFSLFPGLLSVLATVIAMCSPSDHDHMFVAVIGQHRCFLF